MLSDKFIFSTIVPTNRESTLGSKDLTKLPRVAVETKIVQFPQPGDIVKTVVVRDLC